jgi:hypothetical protein
MQAGRFLLVRVVHGYAQREGSKGEPLGGKCPLSKPFGAHDGVRLVTPAPRVR